ncbi:hypothetical protein [Actinokineospora sp. NBRC 105648]|uniref:helix-turn-helix domain-containing protein n=1 Tax=Actinokineospora sp. NBRC 105648 TaxID=3032206 RepID=UPI0024A43FA7|nr:hypothetical protein [Actinokineospora sp. NBRC 105648]GLZ42417.1 hypothetical protein Acsp05_60410 [Actinokineospora sp. NBRC 105648]
MSIDPNALLRAARASRGLTQGQLADLANTEVERATGKPGAMDADYVGKLERGIHRWPNRDYRAALRQVLAVRTDADLGLHCTRSRSGVPQGEEGDDVERKAFLRVLTGTAVGVVAGDLLGGFGAGAGTGGQRVGQVEVEQVRSMTRMFAGQDSGTAGGLSAEAVVAQLSMSRQLLNRRFAQDAVRRQLFAAVAELADLTAGMCLDSGALREAERCFRFAVSCATECEDWSLRAKALAGLTSLSVHQGNAEDALSYAELALVRADRLPPVVRAIVHTKHARALGLSGRHRAGDCLAAVGQAETHFARHTSDESQVRPYLAAHLERDIGRAMLCLAVQGGDYGAAQQRLHSAVAKFPAGSSRAKSLTMANLAHLTMVRADPVEAVSLGHSAVDSVGLVRSERVFAAFRQLRVAGQRYRSIPQVRELNQRITTLLPPATATQAR